MIQQFEFNSETNLIDFLGATVGTDNEATEASYDVDLIFSQDSLATPSMDEVDVLIFAAFNQPFVQDLVALLSELPTSNPFSMTTAVTYTPLNRRHLLA